MREIVTDQNQRIGDWVAQRTGRTCAWGPFQAFGVIEDGEIIGGFIVDNYVRNARASLHGAGNAGKWISRRLLRFVFNYTFNQLKCNILMQAINASNTLSINGTQKLGFREIQRVPNGASDGDLIIFVMQKHECPWIAQKGDAHA